MLETGINHLSSLTVREENTAKKIGSGELDVLSTPSLAALMENAAMLSVKDSLSDDQTTVGGYIELKHLKPSPVGAQVSAVATLTEIKGKKLTFKIEAIEGDTLIGEAVHIRFIVDKKSFY